RNKLPPPLQNQKARRKNTPPRKNSKPACLLPPRKNPKNKRAHMARAFRPVLPPWVWVPHPRFVRVGLGFLCRDSPQHSSRDRLLRRSVSPTRKICFTCHSERSEEPAFPA